MPAFKLTLIAMIVGIVGFTVAAILDGGFDLLTPFFGPIRALNWQGQFNFDFTCYLVLSGIWMAWRQGFSSAGIALGILAPPLGILFLAPFMLYLIARTGGDARKLVMGIHAENA